jgi:hypothetical protein
MSGSGADRAGSADGARGPDSADAGGDAFADAVKPLVDAMGGEMIAPEEAQGDDVVLSWEGRDVVAVRLPHLSESLDHILAELERRHGMPLAELDRKTKQSVVRILETRGAFSVRHGVETVASALGVSRFTVYNYINAQEEKRAKKRRGEE